MLKISFSDIKCETEGCEKSAYGRLTVDMEDEEARRMEIGCSVSYHCHQHLNAVADGIQAQASRHEVGVARGWDI